MIFAPDFLFPSSHEAENHFHRFAPGAGGPGPGVFPVRSTRGGRTSGLGFLDDYANVAHGLIELHAATGELRWLHEAHRLAELAVELFADAEHGGFFLSPADGDMRVPRTKDLQDSPVPSGNSMLAHVLLRLSRIWGDDELERRAVSVFRLVEPALSRAPGFFAWALCGIDLWLSALREIAIVGDVGAPVARAALEPFQPTAVVSVGPSEDVPLLSGKTLVDGRTISVPLAWSWRLSDATPEQSAHYQIFGAGTGIRWPDIDEDLSLRGMLEGTPARRPTR